MSYKKKLTGGIIITAILLSILGFWFLQEPSKTKPVQPPVEPKKEEPVQTVAKPAVIPAPAKVQEVKPPQQALPPKKSELYNSLTNNALPLSAIAELNSLDPAIQSRVNKIIDSTNNIYFIIPKDNGIFLISENPADSRQGIQMIEITADSETIIPVWNEVKEEKANDIWFYDEAAEQKIPIKHVIFDEDDDNEIEYTEIWNYRDDEPIKYEMRDDDDRVISIRKETVDNGTYLRQEHLVYDDDGNTELSLTINYDGADINRITYYNADRPKDGISIFSDYQDGVKVKETVYSADFKVKNVYIPEYKDGTRIKLKVYDNNNQEIETLSVE